MHNNQMLTYPSKRPASAFYMLPSLKEDTLVYTGDGTPRTLSEEGYNKKSTLSKDPGPYAKFYLRAVLGGDGVRSGIGSFLESVATNAFESVAMQSLHTPEAAIRYHVLHSLYHGRANVDTVFGDLFRILYGDAELGSLRVDTAVSERVLDIVREPIFQSMLMPQCKGNSMLSTLTVLSILNQSSTSKAFGDSAAQDSQDDENKQDEQNEDSEGDNNADGSGDGENNEEPNQDGQGGGEGQQQDESSGNSDASGDGDANDSESPDTQPKHSDASMQEALNKAMGQAQQAMDAIDDGNGDAIDMAGELAGDQFKESLEDISQISVVASLVDRAFSHKTSKHMQEHIAKVFDLVGRFRGVESEALTISSIGDGEMIDVTMGDNIERVLPSELIGLATEETEMLFYSKLLEGGLLEAERHGYDEAGFGPVIVMLDISSSMDMGTVNFEGIDASKQQIACAFTMSIVQHCIDQKRDCLVIPFNGNADIKQHAIFSQYLHRPKQVVLADIDRVCSLRSTGGTSFTRALKAVRGLLGKYKHIPFEQADVIFFSDGSGDYPDEAEARKLRVQYLPPGSRVFGLFVVEPSSYANDTERCAQVEESNKELFDVCVASYPDDLREGLKRLYKEVVERGFYHIDQQY